MSTAGFLTGLIILAVGTYLIRLSGVLVGARAQGDSAKNIRLWLDRAAVLILLGVAVTQMVYEGSDLAGPARIIGVTMGVLSLFWKRSLILAVVIAMATTAVLRMVGLG
ncbi:AzlD domain-containing protein [Corynebacterium lubricantis]|uniref:AzlD domain-containing protein n=1 Tax=Corynebacterium lubricantis TaxID=541095 RepID=UPI00035F4F64|nr:AzlD domain-containing protein [Corynebacterium lubricantis]